jgi:hypothetical protein
MMFLRRKHQKLDETCDEFPRLRQCDSSTGSDSVNSFDPFSYTEDSAMQSPIMMQQQKKINAEYPSRTITYEAKSRRFWKFGWVSQQMNRSAKRRKKALAELDKTIMQIRGSSSHLDTTPSRSVLKNNRGISDFDHASSFVDGSKMLPREVTWKRRVSSLEAFFKKECRSKYQFKGESYNESAIMKHIPFEKSIENSESSCRVQDEIGRTKYPRSKPTRHLSSFEETVEQGVSDILGKITSRSEEILENVPDWSVASSSVDFMSTATSDDDVTSVSGYRQFDSSCSPTQRSISSGEDDEFFTPDGGCNSVESCTTLSKEFETFLEEMLPRDLSLFSCYTVAKRKQKRRRKKRL